MHSLRIFQEEIRRQAILWRRYWPNELSFILTIYIFFMIILFTGSAMSPTGSIGEEGKANTLVGMMMWQLSMGCFGVLGWSFFNEAQAGTLEHLYLSPSGVVPILLARSFANFFMQCWQMAISCLLAMVSTGTRLDLPPLDLAIIIPLSVIGTYGFGFIMAALTMTFKRTQALMQLSQFFFLVFTGAMFPLDRMPWAMQVFGETLPVTAGIRALRAITIHGARLGDVMNDVYLMTGTSIFWLVVGVLIFKMSEKHARLKGNIGAY